MVFLGAGVFAGLGPWENGWLGLCTAAVCLALARNLRRAGPGTVLFWSALAALSVSVLAFQWLLPTIIIIGELNTAASVPLFMVHGVVMNLKLPFFFLGMALLASRSRLSQVWIAGALAALGDFAAPQLFPWFYGNLASGSVVLRQSASAVGVYGLSFLLFLQAFLLYNTLRILVPYVRRRRAGRKLLQSTVRHLRGPRGLIAAIVPFAVLTLVYAYGIMRFTNQDHLKAELVNIGFFQPNTGKGLRRLKSEGGFAARAVNTVFNQGLKTIYTGRGRLDLLIIPESAVPFHGTRPSPDNLKGVYSPTYHAVTAFLARTGEVDVLYNELDQRGDKLYNLATIFGREGQRRSSYKKQKLLPFGEYLPGESFIPLLRKLFPEASAYSPGKKPTLLEYQYIPNRANNPAVLPGREELRAAMANLKSPELVLASWPAARPSRTGRLAPLVCYEGLFPGLTREFFQGATQPDFLVNITNDAWFGDYLENYQHSTGARMRAIETGRYLVRATISGVSTVSDHRGLDIVPPTGLARVEERVFAVPRLPHVRTIYLRLGDWPLLGLCALIGLAAFLLRRRKSRTAH